MNIGAKLMAGFGLMLLLTAGLGIVAYTQITIMDRGLCLTESTAVIDTHVGECRQIEKNFQIKEDQKSVDAHAHLLIHIREHLDAVKPLVMSSEDEVIIADAESKLDAYEIVFAQLVADTRKMRVIGDECVARARAIENSTNNADYLDYATTSALLHDILMIRRHEKNFLLRGDYEYVDDVKNWTSTLRADINASTLTTSDKRVITSEVDAYQATFTELVTTKKQIDEYVFESGHAPTRECYQYPEATATGGSGPGPLVASGRDVQGCVVKLSERAIAEADVAAATARIAIIGFVIASITLGILIAATISRSIIGPLGKIMTCANKIRNGDFSYAVHVDSKDELGDLAHIFGIMRRDLQAVIGEMKRVAADAAKGNFDARVKVDAKGEFKELADGMNNMIDVITIPIRENIRILDSYGIERSDGVDDTESNTESDNQ